MAESDDTTIRQGDDWGFDDVEARRSARAAAPAEVPARSQTAAAGPEGPSPAAPPVAGGAPTGADDASSDAGCVQESHPKQADEAEVTLALAAGAVRQTAPRTSWWRRRGGKGSADAAPAGEPAQREPAARVPAEREPAELEPGAREPAAPQARTAPAEGTQERAAMAEKPQARTAPADGKRGRIMPALKALAAATADPVGKQAKAERAAAQARTDHPRVANGLPGAPGAAVAGAPGLLPAPERGEAPAAEARAPWPQRLKAFARRHVAAVAFFGLWSLILAFPYFGLGSASFVVLHDTAEMNLPRAVWYGAADAQTGLGAWSSMGVSGTDRLASGLSRDLDTFLFMVLPGWLAYGLFMWLQRFVAGFFLYRLLRDWRHVSPPAAACVACAYALFTQPHINMGWTGFALYDGLALPGLPLVLYLLFRCERWRARYRYPVIASAGFLFALGSHFFLAFFCVGVAVILAMAAFPHRDKRFFWAAPLLFAAAWFAGELPVLWAAAVNAAGSQRADHDLLTLNTQGGVAYKQWLPKFLADNFLALVLAAAAFVLALVRRAWRVLVVAVVAGLCLLVVAYAPFFRESVFSHLGPLSGFRFDRLFVVLPFLALFAGGLGLGLLPRRTPTFGFGSLGGRTAAAAGGRDALREAGSKDRDAGAEAGAEGNAAARRGTEGDAAAVTAAVRRERTVVAAEVSLGGNGDEQAERVFVLTRSERAEVEERDLAAPAPAAPERAIAPSPADKPPCGPLLRRRYALPIQAAVGLAILAAVVVQTVGVQRRVVDEMGAGATYVSLYGSPDVAAVAQRQAGAPPFRVASINAPLTRGVRQAWHPGFAWAYGLETADGYAVLYSQRYQDFWMRVIDARIGRSDEIKDYFRRWGNRVYLFASRNYLSRPGGIEAARRWNISLLSLANVRYFISPVQLRDAGFTLLPSTRRQQQLAWSKLSGWQKTTRAWGGEFPGLPLYIYENRNVFPRAFLVGRARVLDTGGKVLDEMAVAGQDGLRSTAFLTRQDRNTLGLREQPLGAAGGGSGKVSITSYKADEVAMTVQADGRRVIVLTNSYSRFWQASVDGQKVAVAPVDHTFLGAVVPGGRHQVVFKYRPPYGVLAWQ